MKPTILVTGATGKTGGAVARELRQRDWPVRAIIHKRDARSTALDALGIETVVADLYDPDQVLHAMRGTQRAYFCPPFHPYMIQSASVFATAARDAKLESIVILSQWLAAPDNPSLLTRQSWLAEQILSMVPGTTHTIVAPGYFADNYLRLMNFAAHLGVFPMTVQGDSRNAPPSNEDIARVAVEALVDPERHAGKRYRPTGLELISVRDMAGIIGKAVGRTVRHVNMPMWMFARAARMQGVSAYELSSWRYYSREHDQGAFDAGAPTSDVFDVTGRQPEAFETIARRYAAMPFAKRSFGNVAREMVNFMRVPLSPGYDLAGFEKRHFIPTPPSPRVAMDSSTWRGERGLAASLNARARPATP